MLSAYDRIRVINLAERQDRRREVTRQLRRFDLRAEFFLACKPAEAAPFRSKGEHGCYLSHLEILKGALADGGSVLILEDDCDFTKEAGKVRAPFDLLWGGFSIREDYIQGSHCMGFQAATVARLVPYLEELMKRDPTPIDGAYLRFCRDNPDIQVDACDPPIAVQRPSYSDVSGRMGIDRIAWLRPAVALLRRAKRLVQHREVGGSFEELRRAGQTKAG